MISYRNLIHSFQRKNNLSADQSLASISFILRAVGHQLSPRESVVLRMNIAPELRQLINESRSKGRHDGQQALDLISGQLEISLEEAKKRTLSFFDELRAHTGPWDDSVFLEVLDRIRSEIDHVPTAIAAA